MDARAAVAALLAERAAGATVCPSEVARLLAVDAGTPDRWRERMAEVHRAVDALAATREVRLSWNRRPLTVREGPYRIGRGGGGEA